MAPTIPPIRLWSRRESIATAPFESVTLIVYDDRFQIEDEIVVRAARSPILVVAHEKPDNDQGTGNAETPRDEILHVYTPPLNENCLTFPNRAPEWPFP